MPISPNTRRREVAAIARHWELTADELATVLGTNRKPWINGARQQRPTQRSISVPRSSNLEAVTDRELALREIVRVLKSGGWLLLIDIVNQEEYTAYLKTQSDPPPENGATVK